jgi:hypothetical protein
VTRDYLAIIQNSEGRFLGHAIANPAFLGLWTFWLGFQFALISSEHPPRLTSRMPEGSLELLVS